MRRRKGLWDPLLERRYYRLLDGRNLTFFFDGNRNKGPYIFCFHAMMISGNSFIMDRPPEDCCLVCVNRVGYFGNSSPPPNYSYHQFACDIEELADHLHIQHFYVLGHSSGGPCALACASHLPLRVLGVGILSGDPEYAHEGVPDKKQSSQIVLGSFLPCFLACIWVLPMARNSRSGLINDYRLETSLYTFQTEHIEQPAVVFCGQDDSVMPLEISRHLHERLTHSRLVIVPSVGHLGLLRDWVLRDMLEALIHAKQANDDANLESTTLVAVEPGDAGELEIRGLHLSTLSVEEPSLPSID